MNKETLLDYLRRASEAYYSGHPIIDDDTFDRLALLADYNEVGTARDGEIKHPFRMYSLQKFYQGEDTSPPTYDTEVRTPKLDGASICIVYVDGKLVSVATRGDGFHGKNITNKFTHAAINEVPLEIDHTGLLQLTVECVSPKEIPNARNYAAGALNLNSVEEFLTRQVSFIVHGVQPSVTGSYEADLGYLQMCGFRTVMEPGLEDVFPTDGIVVREVYDGEYHDWGFTSHHPKGAYALKVQKESVLTELVGVIWQVGKSGKVTPVALLQPVNIGGAMVSRASLHNPSFIEALDLDIGDTVEVVRSGEIIPYITGVQKRSEKST